MVAQASPPAPPIIKHIHTMRLAETVLGINSRKVFFQVARLPVCDHN
jgi:hypothetical protein